MKKQQVTFLLGNGFNGHNPHGFIYIVKDPEPADSQLPFGGFIWAKFFAVASFYCWLVFKIGVNPIPNFVLLVLLESS